MRKKMLTIIFVTVFAVMTFTACGTMQDAMDVNNAFPESVETYSSDDAESSVVRNDAVENDVPQGGITEENAAEEGANIVEANVWADLDVIVKDIIMKNAEIGNPIETASDIEIDRIFYGSFSQEKANEIFVVCKLLKMPHVAGSDRKAGVLLDADTLQMVAYKEFAADEVVVESIQTAKGRSLILFLGTAISQGWRSQAVYLYEIEGDQWTDIGLNIMEFVPAEKREAWKGNCFCYPLGERIALLYEDDRAVLNPNPEASELIAILKWDSWAETFVVEQSAAVSG